ncbi:MAG: glycosyltransferase [Planctomycetes bacterium]|nr:glycosyltransferase [Planctomycetota bacterium]
MIIHHCVANAADPANGVATLVRGLADAEAATGEQVHVHALLPSAMLSKAIPHFYPRDRCWPVAWARSSQLRAAIDRAAPTADILHTHNLWTDVGVTAPRAAAGTECRLVHSIHGALHPQSRAVGRAKKRLVWTMGQRATLRRSDLLHATSIEEAGHCREAGIRAPIVVVPCGVDVPSLVSRGQRAGRRRVGFAGRLHRIKAVDRLLEAWHAIAAKHPEWELSIRGPDGGVAASLADMAAGLPRVTLGAGVAGSDMSAWYRSCDIVVLPSHAENFGMVVAEALAHGVPVVASTGTPWSGLPGRGCGWWVPNGVDSLAAALDQAMMLSDSTREEMGHAGREWMMAEYTWPRVAERMLAAYRWIRGAGAMPEDIC